MHRQPAAVLDTELEPEPETRSPSRLDSEGRSLHRQEGLRVQVDSDYNAATGNLHWRVWARARHWHCRELGNSIAQARNSLSNPRLGPSLRAPRAARMAVGRRAFSLAGIVNTSDGTKDRTFDFLGRAASSKSKLGSVSESETISAISAGRRLGGSGR